MADPIHTTELVPHFGPRGMCAALNVTPDELTTAYRTGDMAAPDTVHLGEPRWLPQTLRSELARLCAMVGAGPENINARRWQDERMARAVRAEGWQDAADH